MNAFYVLLMVGLGLCVVGLVIADSVDFFERLKKQKGSKPERDQK